MLPVIQVKDLSKAYQIGEFSTGTLSHDIRRWYIRMRGKEDPYLRIGEVNDRTVKSESNIVWSLKDINFEIEQGQAVGIIGRNGAGKSTLLKILSRVTIPTSGTVKVKGRIASLLEVGTGFHPELTGRENIYLNGAILGMRKQEIKRKFDEIVDFSGVERYIDTPVKRYSSGMYVRLAFAVAAHLESEILIVDEVLAVGDVEFQKKCIGKMGDVSIKGRTVLFVSHNMQAVTELTSKCIYLNNGTILGFAETKKIISSYLETGQKEGLNYINPIQSETNFIKSIELKTSEQGNVHIHGDPLIVFFEVNIQEVIDGAGFAFQIISNMEVNVVHFWMFDDEYPDLFKKKGTIKFSCTIPRCRIFKGKYSINAYLSSFSGRHMIEAVDHVCPFEVEMFNNQRNHPWVEGTSTYVDDFKWKFD